MISNRYLILLFSLFCFVFKSQGQEEFVDISKISSFQHLAPHAKILEDPEHLFTVEQILKDSAIQAEYFSSDAEIPYMDFTRSTYWMKLKVENPTDEKLTYYIELARPLTNVVRLYVYNEDGSLDYLHESGDIFPFDHREYEHRRFVFPHQFPAHSKKILIIETESDGEILKLPIKFWVIYEFTQFVSKENFYIGLYYGLFILVIILYSLFGIALREKLYLYFVSYVFALAIFQFSLDGLAYQFFWRENPWLANHAILIFASLAMLGMLLYVQQFLDFSEGFKKYNAVYKVFIFLVVISLLVCLSSGIFYSITYPILNALSFLAVLFILLGIVMKARKDKKLELPILLAFLALTVSSTLFILANVDLIHSEFLASNSLKLGSASEMIFLSIAMAGRYRKTQLDKMAAQESVVKQLEEINELKSQQTEKLEIEVAERTKEIQQKNTQLSTQNEEILNSINYAQRLQDAILPTDEELSSALPNSDILFLPKDIVSGDFYWMKETENHVYFAVADCTGHGVPGAMVSVLGYNSLNRCIQEFNLRDAGKILDKLRELVIETFSNDKIKVSDGMDIALCVWDKKSELQFAGAYNPLYHIQNGELNEIKGDKQPIGYFDNTSPFQTHTIKLQQGDSIVLFSDGYADQFGGPKGKKFKYSQFKELLLENQGKKSPAWRTELKSAFNAWRGKEEQIDDVCVLTVDF